MWPVPERVPPFAGGDRCRDLNFMLARLLGDGSDFSEERSCAEGELEVG